MCSSFESGSRMNPPRWERFICRGMRYMNIHLYAAQVYCNSWPHISDFIKVENSQVWRKFPGYGCEYQIIELEASWGLDCYDTKIIFRCCSYLTYDKDKQKVTPPRGFSAPAPWKVPPPRGIPDECPRLVAYIWRGHFGWIPWGGGTPLNLS